MCTHCSNSIRIRTSVDPALVQYYPSLVPQSAPPRVVNVWWLSTPASLPGSEASAAWKAESWWSPVCKITSAASILGNRLANLHLATLLDEVLLACDLADHGLERTYMPVVRPGSHPKTVKTLTLDAVREVWLVLAVLIMSTVVLVDVVGGDCRAGAGTGDSDVLGGMTVVGGHILAELVTVRARVDRVLVRGRASLVDPGLVRVRAHCVHGDKVALVVAHTRVARDDRARLVRPFGLVAFDQVVPVVVLGGVVVCALAELGSFFERMWGTYLPWCRLCKLRGACACAIYTLHWD
jgi:hypothetical protein